MVFNQQFEISQLISPSGIKTLLHLPQLDPDRLAVRLVPSEIGIFRIHVRFNAVEISQSPLRLVAECNDDLNQSIKKCKIFFNDGSKLKLIILL